MVKKMRNLADAVCRWAVRPSRARATLRAAEELCRQASPAEQAGGRLLQTLLNPASADGAATRIEAERRRLLADHSPLVNEALGAPGLFDEGKTVADAAGVSESSRAGRVMLRLAEGAAPARVLELGTNVGISSSYLAAGALAANPAAGLVTLDASLHRVAVAKDLHQRLGLSGITYETGLFEDTLSSALEEHGPFDLVYIDGDHQYEPTLGYFEQIRTHVPAGGLILFDDIRWSDGMLRAWKEIRGRPSVDCALDLYHLGLCRLDAGRDDARYESPVFRFLV